MIDVIEILVDTQTGVNYIFHRNGNAAGFTPLLDKDGKPVVYFIKSRAFVTKRRNVSLFFYKGFQKGFQNYL